jgi:uncharacterized protein YcbK (DUF882 family)
MLIVDWNNPASMVSAYFTVAEVTQGDDRRIPTDPEHICNILSLALELDKLREAWGHPIQVTSGYRPYEINLEVGGVENSQHIYGAAADIYSDKPGLEEYLEEHWGGGVGRGMASDRGFTHIDLREGGYGHGSCTIRWDY